MKKASLLLPAVCLSLSGLFLLTVTIATAGEVSEPIKLFPEGLAGEPGELGPERFVEKEGENPKVIRLTDVTVPSITIFHPDKPKNGTAVIVCPGGGYNILAYEHEGTQVCEWLNQGGVTAILLKYRVPRREGRPVYEAPLEDAQRAISLTRKNAAEWGIDPDKIGILGFSAGGNLAAMAMTNYETRTYPQDEAIDSVSCRPDFGVLVYPAYLLDEQTPGQLAPQFKVTDDTPPAILFHADNDRISAEGSARFYLALKQHKIPAELHVFVSGGHGFGMRDTEDPIEDWTGLVEDWMEVRGLVSGE